MAPPPIIAVSMRIKDVFLDRWAVEQRVDKAKLAVLSKAGAHVRTRARSKLRRRKRTSVRGEAPSVHAKSGEKVRTLRFILFGLADDNTVFVGPVGFNQKRQVGGEWRSGTVPNTLEFGRRGVGVREKLENLAAPSVRPRGGRKPGKKRRQLSEAQIAAIRRKRVEALAKERYEPGVKWVPIGKRQPLPGQPVRVRMTNYEERPFMRPSLEEEAPNFPGLFHNSLVAAT